MMIMINMKIIMMMIRNQNRKVNMINKWMNNKNTAKNYCKKMIKWISHTNNQNLN